MASRVVSRARTFSTNIAKYVKNVELGMDDVIIEFAEGVSQELIKLSPVDTGRFRSNWQITANEPANTSLLSTDRVGTLTQARNKLEIRNIMLGGGAVRSIYFSNMLIYANALEYGYSKQAPQGVVGITAARLSFIMNDAIRAIRKRNAL